MQRARFWAITALACALSLAAWGQGVGDQRQVQPVAARELFEFGPSWSALNTIVFFAGTPPVVSDPQLDLVTVDGDGNDRRKLTQTPGRDWQPWFSADGHTIYFSSEREGNPEIYALDALDARPVALTHNGANNFTPFPSPDGRLLAFAADVSGNMELYVLELEQGKLTQITHDPGRDWLPAWNPNGTSIAFVSNRNGNDDLFLADLSQGLDEIGIVQLTTDEGSDTRVNWYDAKLLVWESDRRGNLDLFSAALQGEILGEIRTLTHAEANDFGRVAFSPKGDRMAFSSTRFGTVQLLIADVLLPFSQELDADGDHVLEDEEVARAIALWAQGQNLEGVGRPLSDALIVRLVDLWVRGSALDGVL